MKKMLLTDEKSLCKKNQKIIVSRDKGTKREHRAINLGGASNVRQYKLDGGIFHNVKCCDYLILNDTEGQEKAIYVELKGGNLDEAIPQLENARKLTQNELNVPNQRILYRIICSRIPTHKIRSSKMLKFKERLGDRLIVTENVYEEVL